MKKITGLLLLSGLLFGSSVTAAKKVKANSKATVAID